MVGHREGVGVIQFKVRTEYTFGQTFAPLDKLIACLKEQGCTAAGIVDSNSTWGHVHWYNKCKEAGIRPLLGVELVVSDDDTTTRMWFLAKNKAGLSELYQASSKAHQRAISTRVGSFARLYRKDVERMSSDIMIFAGDILDKKFLVKVDAVIDLNPSSKVLNIQKQRMAEDGKLLLIETSDNAYAKESDKSSFEFASKASVKTTPQHLLNTLQHRDMQEALLAEFIDYELPHAPMIRAEGDLEALCRQGIIDRKMDWVKEYEDRLVYELNLIKEKDYESYFLVVADMVHYAKQHMLVGPSRGSAAGSLVCYLARITEIDPIPPGLFFERFIDITRTDLPDIDLDFPDKKREMVFDYMSKKYGENNTAHIGTVSRFKPKSALIHVCKALNIPPTATGAVKVAMIERSMADARASNCLVDTFETTGAGKDFIRNYPEAMAATVLEGHASHTGVHAAGLLVCNDDITKYCTIDAYGIAHVDKGAAEEIGLLKIDVLGLRTLTILEDSGVDIDWYNLGFDDEPTYDIFRQGRLCGIFQFEGDALRSISDKIKFESLNEIDAVTALARPGPFATGVTQSYIKRMNGEPYQHIHKLVSKHMEKTFGLPIYQEQTLAIVRDIGNFDWEETSAIRRAMSKIKGKEYFDTYWPKFKSGAKSHGIAESEARETWELINAMGSWQMNKAHTYSYAVISYWCAHLKAHHLIEFAASVLRNAKTEEHAILLLRELAKEGIEYVPFDPDKSELNWSVKEGKLYGGILALKGYGVSKGGKFISMRESDLLTEKMRENVLKAENPFKEIFPFHKAYGHLYDDPEGNGIADELTEIENIQEGIPHGHERVFIAEVIHKNSRNANEEAEIKKRGGKIEKRNLEYLDLRFRDDSGTIGGRIGRKDYKRIGIDLLENVPVGAHLMVRAKFWNGIRYTFIQKWKRIDND